MHHNRAKTVALLGSISVVVVFVGSRWGWPGLCPAAVLVVALIGYVHRRSDTIGLRAMRAYRVTEAEQPALHRVVRGLTVKARVPMPSIYVSPTHAVNAFATGRGPRTAAVCCTEGILSVLDERELRAVLAHELAHIRRRDTLLSAAAGAVASAIMAPAGWGPSTARRRGSPAGRLLLPVLAPVAAAVVRLVVRPGREYAADAQAARITGDPLGLASALRKVEASTRQLVLPPERDIVASSHMMIAGPLQQAGVARLFASHPPMAERVARLEQRAGYRR